MDNQRSIEEVGLANMDDRQNEFSLRREQFIREFLGGKRQIQLPAEDGSADWDKSEDKVEDSSFCGIRHNLKLESGRPVIYDEVLEEDPVLTESGVRVRETLPSVMRIGTAKERLRAGVKYLKDMIPQYESRLGTGDQRMQRTMRRVIDNIHQDIDEIEFVINKLDDLME